MVQGVHEADDNATRLGRMPKGRKRRGDWSILNNMSFDISPGTGAWAGRNIGLQAGHEQYLLHGRGDHD